MRYDEDYSYLADPARRTGPWDAIKYIPLDANGRTYLSLGGEWRERYEHLKGYINNPGSDNILMHRMMVHADLHIGSNFRTFVQLSNLLQGGRDGGSIATDENHLDFQQAFFDVTVPTGEGGKTTFRFGRHEMTYGSSRLVSVREGPNSRRSFDGGRVLYRSQTLDLDAFVVRPVVIQPGIFDDKWDSGKAFWGAYGVARTGAARGIDFYYFGNDYNRSVYAAGAAEETRHTIGTRVWGTVLDFDYNLEAIYQFGRFGNLDISAFGTSVDLGWTLSSWRFTPRIGIKANVESGDRNPTDGKLGTFNPLFPNHAYFSEAAVGAPMNDIDFQPNITFKLSNDVSLRVGYDFFWRYSTQDAVYSAAALPMPGIAGRDGRYVGNLITSHLQWRVDPYVELNFDYTHFEPSSTLKAANVNAIDFAMASVAYKF